MDHIRVTRQQVVWITGAASGVGRHLVKAFLRRGFLVMATDLRLETLEEVSIEDRWDKASILLESQDIRKFKDWSILKDQLLEKWKRWDIMLNVAGYLRPMYLGDATSGEISKHLDTNVKGLIYGCQTASQHMIEQGFGHIINIGSLAGIAPIPGNSLYSASKFAVRGMSLALSQELAPHGVHVSLMSPDVIDTPMLDLQLDYPEAALSFSGDKALTVYDIEQALFAKVLPDHPMEVTLPLQRGLTAKFASLLPALNLKLGGFLRKRGLQKQERLRRLQNPEPAAETPKLESNETATTTSV